MFEDYIYKIEKYKWNMEEGETIPSEFSFDPNLAFVSGTGNNRVNIQYYGANSLILSGGGMYDYPEYPNMWFTKENGVWKLNYKANIYLFSLEDVYDAFLNAGIPDITITKNGSSDFPYNGGGYLFVHGAIFINATSVEDINFFSYSQPELEEELIIDDYLIDIGDIEYQLEETERESNKINMYVINSDIRLKLSGIYNNSYLFDFFGINQDMTLYKYKFIITNKYNDEVKYTGIINQNDVKEEFNSNQESEQIEVQALGMLQEFKDYYSNVKLPDPSNMEWSLVPVQGFIKNNFKLALQRYIYPYQNLDIQMDANIENYDLYRYFRIYDTPSSSRNYSLVKYSYEAIYSLGENCFDFLRRVCNSMGWVFYFDNETLIIKNRYNTGNNVKTLDYYSFIDYTAKKTKSIDGIKHIVIRDGEINSGESSIMWNGKGHKSILISDSKHYNNFSPMYYLEGYQPMPAIGVKWMNETIDDDTTYKYDLWQCFDSQILPTYSVTDALTLRPQDILFLDVGDPSEKGHGHKYNITNGVWSYVTSNSCSTDEVFFSGNYGNCLGITLDNGKTKFYQDYISTDDFARNFVKFFSQEKNTILIEVNYPGTDITLFDGIEVINNELLLGSWNINKISYDICNDNTKMELQKLL